MARGMLSPAGLMVLIVVLVLVVHQACSANDSHHLCPPSCGNIHNIKYPFRLNGDPENCGDQRYNLSCENDQTLVLNLYAGRYYVQEINYINYTIRVVDPGILNTIDPFIPRYSLDMYNFSSGDPYGVRSYTNVVFVNCEKPLNSGMYVDNSTCFKNGVYSSHSSLSHSKRYRYLLLHAIWDLEDLCQVEQVSLTSWSHEYGDDFRNNSCTDIHNQLLRGFELSWYRANCGSCRYADCGFNYANNKFFCNPNGAGLLLKLLLICGRALEAVIKLLVPRTIRDKFGIPDISEYHSEFGEVSI